MKNIFLNHVLLQEIHKNTIMITFTITFIQYISFNNNKKQCLRRCALVWLIIKIYAYLIKLCGSLWQV